MWLDPAVYLSASVLCGMNGQMHMPAMLLVVAFLGTVGALHPCFTGSPVIKASTYTLHQSPFAHPQLSVRKVHDI